MQNSKFQKVKNSKKSKINFEVIVNSEGCICSFKGQTEQTTFPRKKKDSLRIDPEDKNS